MTHQDYFNYNLKEIRDSSNFFVNSTNLDSYNIVINNNTIKNIFLKAPNKSGKSHLISMWVKNNNAILYKSNLKNIIDLKKNVAIDNLFVKIEEENIFHIINHCKNENLKILGGIMGADILDVAGVNNVATLPSLDEARAKIVVILRSPAQKIASILLAPASKIAILALEKSKK